MVSLIIPVYNTPIEDFRRCLLSISEQKYKDIEVIIVNDGSDVTLASQYEKEIDNSYMSIIHTDNGGVSKARNIGIEHSQGEFLVFIDADDEITENFLVNGMKEMEDESVDIVIGEMMITSNKDKPQFIEKKLVLENEEILWLRLAQFDYPTQFQYGKNQGVFIGSPCAKIYRKRYIRDILFPEEVSFFEDQLYNSRVLKHVKKVILLPEIFYKYWQNEYSAMNKSIDSEDYVSRMNNYYKSMEGLLLSEEEVLVKKAICIKNINDLNYLIQSRIIPSDKSLFQKISILRTIMGNNLYKMTIKETNYYIELPLNLKISYLLIKTRMAVVLYFCNICSERIRRIEAFGGYLL